MNLDVPSTLDKIPTYEDFMKALNQSVENFEFFEKNRKNTKAKMLNVLHGETYELMNIWYEKVKDFNFDGFAIGMKPAWDPMIQARGFLFLKEKGEFDKESFKWLHFFGTSGKHVVPTLIYAATKLDNIEVSYDSSSYNMGSIYRRYQLPFNIGPMLYFGDSFKEANPGLKELPCDCPVCKSIGSIDELNTKEIFAGTLISLHNMYQYINYNDTLNSLVDNKEKFLEYLKALNISEKTLKSIEFIDFGLEHGLKSAIEKYHEWLIPQDLDKTKQVNIFHF